MRDGEITRCLLSVVAELVRMIHSTFLVDVIYS